MSVVKCHLSLDVHWVFEVWSPPHGEDVWVAPDPAQVGHVQEEAALTSSNHSLTVNSDASGSGKGVEVVPVQLLLVFSEVDAEDVLVLGLEVRDENIVVKTLHAAFEQVGQDETPSLHDPNVPLS